MNEAANAGGLGTLDIMRIMEMIPHRYPMLMVDRLIEIVPGVSAVGIKNVTINEPQFQGHFPSAPVMPGVMIVEAMAQTAGILAVHSLGPDAEGRKIYFMAIDDCRFRRPVVPGDVMRIKVTKLHARARVWRFEGEVTVDGQRAAEAKYSAMILDR